MKKTTNFFYPVRNGLGAVYLMAVLMLGFCLSTTAQTVDLISATGTWTAPLGVTSVKVEAWGGGGGAGGGNTNLTAGGGGGGGGAYTLNATVSVVPNTTYNITIGAGGAGAVFGDLDGSPGGITTAVFGATTVTANGGVEGYSATTGGAGGVGTYSGGTAANGFTILGGSGGGGGSSAGSASNGNNGSGVNGGAAVLDGGAGGAGGNQVGPGTDGFVPGGGGGGGGWWALGFAGGSGAAGQVRLTYTINPTCTTPCIGWIIQDCKTCPQGCYADAGALVTPQRTMQTASFARDTSNYGYIFWSFNAIADSTYYFDLCSSVGTAGQSWLRLHKDRITGNNYCMNVSSTPTTVLENMENGCTGTASGLSKLIWTCRTSGTYYLESAIGLNMTPWGATGAQTAVLNYKTLSSSSKVCSTVFYDKGSDGTDGSVANYNNNEDWIYTYYPVDTVADAISVQFLSFSTGPGDVLCVFNGNTINAPVIGCYSGPSITGAFMSSANDGSLTFQFSSSDNTVSTGWEATITCVPSLGVSNSALTKGISISPNPVTDKLTIAHQLSDLKDVEIYNAVGERVSALLTFQQLSQSTLSVDVNALSAGVYFVKITNEGGNGNLRFVKQ